jgi:hypothetical protein
MKGTRLTSAACLLHMLHTASEAGRASSADRPHMGLLGAQGRRAPRQALLCPPQCGQLCHSPSRYGAIPLNAAVLAARGFLAPLKARLTAAARQLTGVQGKLLHKVRSCLPCCKRSVSYCHLS